MVGRALPSSPSPFVLLSSPIFQSSTLILSCTQKPWSVESHSRIQSFSRASVPTAIIPSCLFVYLSIQLEKYAPAKRSRNEQVLDLCYFIQPEIAECGFHNRRINQIPSTADLKTPQARACSSPSHSHSIPYIPSSSKTVLPPKLRFQHVINWFSNARAKWGAVSSTYDPTAPGPF